MQGVGLYVPAGPAQPYTQQLMSQYQVPYFGPYPPQLSMGASASMPPPPVPPPTTNAVITAPPPFQLIQVRRLRFFKYRLFQIILIFSKGNGGEKG
ncbi:unnamed protein product [Gongylonema pulchrum]|uniref:DAZ-associated protein 2 n=1 Tax=Gongylonema pulchrum TaxID=637853 RepID=A0A183DIX5_9BILA|nr:unnamed protein product [Gongylonema pulchrum]